MLSEACTPRSLNHWSETQQSSQHRHRRLTMLDRGTPSPTQLAAKTMAPQTKRVPRPRCGSALCGWILGRARTASVSGKPLLSPGAPSDSVFLSWECQIIQPGRCLHEGLPVCRTRPGPSCMRAFLGVSYVFSKRKHRSNSKAGAVQELS